MTVKFIDQTFFNLGYLRAKLPNKLYKSLLKECLSLKDNKPLITDLTSSGVPKHYYLKHNEEFYDFIHTMHKEYEKKFPGSSDLLILKNEKQHPFYYKNPWINIQKENEFIPYHVHEGIFSYTIWIKIPYNSKNKKYEGNFEFVYTDIVGKHRSHTFNLSKEDEGTIIMFPSKLGHIVWPFYKNKQSRISISGNILLTDKEK